MSQPNVFRIRFDGLVSYVPKRDPADEKPPTEVLMVMPNLRLPSPIKVGSAKNPDLTVTPPPHIACAVVEERFVDPKSSLKPALVFERRDGLRYALYSLIYHNVRVRLDAKPALQYHHDLHTSPNDEPQALVASAEKDPHDLRWVPPLALTGLKGAEVFDRAQVAEADLPSLEGGLIGTYSVEHGTLRSVDVYREEDGTPRLFEYSTVDGAPIFAQPLARAVENVIETAEPVLELELTPADDPGSPKSLHLRTLDDSRWTPIVFYNRELEVVIGVGEPTTTRVGAWDTDPAVLYGLSKYRAAFYAQPRAVTKVPDIGRDRPGCDPLSFAGWA